MVLNIFRDRSDVDVGLATVELLFCHDDGLLGETPREKKAVAYFAETPLLLRIAEAGYFDAGTAGSPRRGLNP